MMPRMVQTFREEGIEGYNIGGKVGNTMDSHRLLEHALATGGAAKQDALVTELFRRYFIDGRALSSRACLLEAAAACELSGAEALLDGDGYSEQVWAEVEGAYKAGVSGVPYFRIDGGGRGKEVSGGQPPEEFLRIFAALGPPRAAPAAAPLAGGHAVGGRVRVHGLQSKPEHNGCLGTVLGAQPGAERVQVRLDGGVELALRAANLVAAAPADAHEGAVDTA